MKQLPLVERREAMRRFMNGHSTDEIGWWLEHARNHILCVHHYSACQSEIHRQHAAHAVEQIIRSYIRRNFKF